MTAYFQFAADSRDNIGMLLDNVLAESVDTAPVPEPSTLLLLGGGLIGLGLYRKNRKKA